MPGVRRLPSGKLQGWYFDALGRRRYWTSEDLKATKRQVMAVVARLEDDHQQIRMGYRPARTSADRHRARPLTELVKEYLAWGAAQGGLGGQPWANHYLRQVDSILTWWRTRLGLETVGDLRDVLPRVEEELRGILERRTGGTAQNYLKAITGLCRWAQRRGYLDGNPLDGIASIDATPRRQRRALTTEELAALVLAAPGPRQLIYQVAVASGLRANELRSLTEADLDVERGGLILRAAWTKNRRAGFQPLPAELVAQLAAGCTGKATARLLEVPLQVHVGLENDLRKSGIPKWTPAGVLDFHSLRVTYVTWLTELSAASVREIQALARHASPTLTMGTYAKVRDTGLRAAVERIGTVLAKSCAPGAHGGSRPQEAAAGSDCQPTATG